MFPTQDGRVVVFAGYCKEKVKKKEVGVTLIDMFLLSPDKHDDTGVKWRWQTVKQVRAWIESTVIMNTKLVLAPAGAYCVH